jgi:hypothetical protein
MRTKPSWAWRGAGAGPLSVLSAAKQGQLARGVLLVGLVVAVLVLYRQNFGRQFLAFGRDSGP